MRVFGTWIEATESIAHPGLLPGNQHWNLTKSVTTPWTRSASIDFLRWQCFKLQYSAWNGQMIAEGTVVPCCFAWCFRVLGLHVSSSGFRLICCAVIWWSHGVPETQWVTTGKRLSLCLSVILGTPIIMTHLDSFPWLMRPHLLLTSSLLFRDSWSLLTNHGAPTNSAFEGGWEGHPQSTWSERKSDKWAKNTIYTP